MEKCLNPNGCHNPDRCWDNNQCYFDDGRLVFKPEKCDMKKPLSMTPAAIRSRKYRGEIKKGRERTRGKKPPSPSTKVRGTVFQPWDVGQPTTMRQRIRDLAVAHMIRTSGQNLDYRARQKLLKNFDADLAALDAPSPSVNLRDAMKFVAEAGDKFGVKPTDAGGVLYGAFPSGTSEDAKPFIDPNPGPARDRSEIVAEMKAQRAAPKQARVVGQPIYSVETQDASKMRECLAECAKIVADAIVQGAKIIAGKETATAPSEMADHDAEWNPVGPGTPLSVWLETAEILTTLVGGTITKGFNTCMCRIRSIGDEPEWIEKEGGRTTVTHSTFAPPTHWRWPA